MTDNLYQSPESNVSLVDDKPFDFYVVGSRKFLILFFATFSGYAVYWFYKNWRLYSNASGKKVWPVMRGLFSIFFTHSLFRLIEGKAKEANVEQANSLRGLATLYVICVIAERGLSRLAFKEIGEPYTDIASLFVTPLIGFILYRAQKLVNFCCDPNGEHNQYLSGANYAWIFIGVLFWLMYLFSLYLTIFNITL